MSPRNLAVDRRSRSPEKAPSRVARRPSWYLRLERQTDEGWARDATEQHERSLRRHLGLPDAQGMTPPAREGPAPLFFIEVAPGRGRAAQCQLPGCFEIIRPGTYRLALNPSMDYGSQKKAGTANPSLTLSAACLAYALLLDLYHINCFEKVADFSQSSYNKRLCSLTRNTFGLRGLQGNQILDGDYLCDGGAERLVEEYKVARGRLLDARDGVTYPDEEPMSPAFDDLYRNAGSADFKYEPVAGLDWYESILMSRNLAPWESHDKEESHDVKDEADWNLFDEYLIAGDVEDRHTLSTTLAKWRLAKVRELPFPWVALLRALILTSTVREQREYAEL